MNYRDPMYEVDESSRVLCPDLYNKLRMNFPGGVKIANQGEGMSQASMIVDGQPYTQVRHSGEYYRVCCPFCKDTRHRLWINHMYGQPDVTSKPMRFLAYCYNENCLSNFNNWKTVSDTIIGFRNAKDRQRPVFAVSDPEWLDPEDIGKVEPPGDVIPFSQFMQSTPGHPAVDYMCRQRRYTRQMLDHYEISYCVRADSRYGIARNRIIFPIRTNGELVGWQARSVGEPPLGQPKYWGCPHMKKRLILYNYDNAKDKNFVVVTEGVTDCHAVGDYSVALLGKTVTRYQYDMIMANWTNKPVILIFDPDAKEQMRATMHDMLNNDMIVVTVDLPDGYDCGDYDRNHIWNIIHAKCNQRGVQLQM